MLKTVHQDSADEDLIFGLVEKDKESLTMISARYGRSIFGVAYRMGFSPEDSEEIVQEWLIKLWTKAESWDASKGVPGKAWIYKVATNLCIDWKRKHSRKKEYGFSEGFDAEGTEKTDQRQQDQEVGAIVKQGLDQLPEQQRKALVLSYYEELSHKEVAEIMETTPKAVEGLIGRARKALRSVFEGQEEFLI